MCIRPGGGTSSPSRDSTLTHEPALPRGNDPAIPRENDRRRGGPFAIDGSSGGAGTESLRRTTQPPTPRSSPSAMPAPTCRASRSLVAKSTPAASPARSAWRQSTGPISTGFITPPTATTLRPPASTTGPSTQSSRSPVPIAASQWTKPCMKKPVRSSGSGLRNPTASNTDAPYGSSLPISGTRRRGRCCYLSSLFSDWIASRACSAQRDVLLSLARDLGGSRG